MRICFTLAKSSTWQFVSPANGHENMIARSMGAVFLIEKLFIQDADVSLPAEWLVTWMLFIYERA